MKDFRADFVRPAHLTLVAASFLLFAALSAFAADSLARVKSVYVEPLGQGKLGEELRERLISRLRKDGNLAIVETSSAADAVITGTGQIWASGYVASNPRSPATTSHPVYTGYLSARITDKNGAVLWSYLVTPKKLEWGGIVHDLADNLAVKLLEARHEEGGNTALAAAPSTDAVTLHGAGATFPAPLYQEWFQSFAAQRPGQHVSYDAVGSDEGIRLLADAKIDFAASDMPLSDPRMAELGKKFQHFASVLGAVVPIYNLSGIKHPLHFTPEVLAEIYLGKITHWNDPRVRADNRGVSLPDAEIVVVHRSDGSGTTFVWSDFLSRISPEWKSQVGSGSVLPWPVGRGAEHNEGVAALVHDTPNAIGYVEMVYALQHQLSFGEVRNAAGNFVHADLASVTAAAATAASNMNSDFRISITNAAGSESYPIASFTWLLLPSESSDAARKNALTALMQWILTAGQRECSELGYAPLPRQLAARELELLAAQK